MKKILALTEENIPEISQLTGQTVEQLADELIGAIHKNQIRMFVLEDVYVSTEVIWDVIQHLLDREIEVPPPSRKHIKHSWKVDWKAPFNVGDLPMLDQLHKDVGLERFWMNSQRRAEIVLRGF